MTVQLPLQKIITDSADVVLYASTSTVTAEDLISEYTYGPLHTFMTTYVASTTFVRPALQIIYAPVFEAR